MLADRTRSCIGNAGGFDDLQVRDRSLAVANEGRYSLLHRVGGRRWRPTGRAATSDDGGRNWQGQGSVVRRFGMDPQFCRRAASRASRSWPGDAVRLQRPWCIGRRAGHPHRRDGVDTVGRQPDPRPLDGPSGDHFQSDVVLADGVRATYLLEARGEGRTEVLLVRLRPRRGADGWAGGHADAWRGRRHDP